MAVLKGDTGVGGNYGVGLMEGCNILEEIGCLGVAGPCAVPVSIMPLCNGVWF